MDNNNKYLHLHIFERVSSMTDDGFIVVNRAGEVIHINKKYCNFLADQFLRLFQTVKCLK